ncbi:MAG: AraC family transcriptional regulator [Spirochaetes bacterium]|nr:AraC family transcriptional regulator [Spirochaetota bacterium]MBU0956701.1 AraC family transcriptional regulator [Spirochaetota bacterium]
MISREEFLRKEYEARINQAIDFVYSNYPREFDLHEMADAASFSRFHFHRLFQAFTGETPGEFVRRIRLAMAAGMLRKNPDKSITEIALACGFSGPSVFARQFKESYGMAAGVWRKSKQSQNAGNEGQAQGKQSQQQSKAGQAGAAQGGYTEGTSSTVRREYMSKLDYQACIKELPELTVAYARHIGPYNQIGEAFERLSRWAGPRGLMTETATILAVYHDDTDVTPVDKLRSSACISVPAGTASDGDIGLMTIPGGKFAVGHFEISGDQFGDAWMALMGEWIPASGWQPDDRMCYEVYLNDHEQHPQKKFIVDICEPVKPL